MLFSLHVFMIFSGREQSLKIIVDVQDHRAAVLAAKKWLLNRCEALSLPKEQWKPGCIKVYEFFPGVPEENGYIRQLNWLPFYEWKYDRGTSIGMELDIDGDPVLRDER